MSDFYGKAYNPRTKKVEQAHYMDDFFSRHVYGVSFVGDEMVYTVEETEIPKHLKEDE